MISSEILIVLLVASVTALIFERFRLPALLGFILAGTLIGPHGFRWISEEGRIHDLAELGMIFLMLTIGLEFSFDRLKGLKKTAFWSGGAQILLSIGVSMLASAALGWTPYQGFVLGSVIALSSTAVVFRNLVDRGQLDSEHGRLCVAILVFQDLAVGPLLIFIQSFGGSGVSVTTAILFSLAKAAALLIILLAISKFILPKIMRWITLSRSREIFMLTTVLLCFGTSWISFRLGLSAPLGAFFAGLMLANTEYHYQIAGEVMPFRHIFVSIFFVSIGLLFDPAFSFMHWHTVLPVSALILFVNAVITTLILLMLKYSPRVAITTGLILSQIGEFSFLLLENAKKGQLIDSIFYQTILSSAVFTIMLTPFLFSAITPLIKLLSKIPLFGAPPQPEEDRKKARQFKDHIILCGYGTSGQDLAAALLLEKIPFVVIEMNPANIAKAKRHQVSVYYGDAINESVLREVVIEKARAVVISFGDASGLAVVIRAIQNLNPKVLIVVRCRYERDIARFYELGADFVIMEELEVSAELTRVILEYEGRAKDVIDSHILRIRARKEFIVEQNILRRMK